MHAVVSGDKLDEACAVAFLDAAAFIVAAFLAFAGQLIGQGAGAISGFALSCEPKNQMEMPRPCRICWRGGSMVVLRCVQSLKSRAIFTSR